jgi:hypothetical protein
MASLFYMPFRPAYDSAGVSVPGAQAYFTLEGTNTPSPVYSDSGLTAPLSNPLVANGVGKFPTAYLDDSVSYRVRIYGRTAEVGISVPLEEMDPYSTSLFDGPFYAATRTELAGLSTTAGPAILTEAGREGTFVWSSANHAAHVTADTRQGIYVAPASAPTGASGAWVRKFTGAHNVTWFGAIDGALPAVNGPAFLAALAYLHAIVIAGYGYGKGSPKLFIPAGVYDLGTTTLDINHSLIIEGESAGGYAQAGGSVLKWAANTTGIRTQRADTTGATGAGASDYGAAGTTIRNLTLYGAFSGSEGEYHGIHMRQLTVVRDVLINGFAGDGIYTKTKLTAPNTGYVGSSSGSAIDNVTCQNCRNGIYIEEVDSNALLISNPLLTSNRRYGLWSKTTLGSTVISGVIATNGMTAGFPTICSYSGNWYYCLPNQEVGAKANAPSGTTANNTWWGYFRAGGVTAVTPAWVVNATDWRAGGAMRLESSFEQWALLGVYMEPDEAPVQIAASCQALVLSPMLGNPVMFDGSFYGGVLHGTGTGMTASRNFTANGTINSTVDGIDILRTSSDGSHFIGPILVAPDQAALIEVGRIGNGINAVIRPDSTAPGLELRSPDNAACLTITNGAVEVNGTAMATAFKVGANQVVAARQSAIVDATGGATIDTQARTAINAVLTAMRTHGLIA